MSNYSRKLPRAELKAEAKKMLRPNWTTILLVTLIYIIFMGVDSYTYSRYIPGTENVASYSVSGAAGMYATYIGENIDIGRMLIGVLIAIVSALLIQGVMGYCYTAFFIRMAEQKGQKITFGTFVEGFTDAVKAILAFIWQYIWIAIWGLTAIPGTILLIIGAFGIVMPQENNSVLTAMVVIGILLIIASAVLVTIATLRYMFMYQVIADGRGKVGARQSMRYSIAIAKNNIWDLFVLILSFFPWLLLSVCLFGLPFFYVLPYMEATYAACYQWLRDEAFRAGRLDPAALGYVAQATAPAVEVPQAMQTPMATETPLANEEASDMKEDE